MLEKSYSMFKRANRGGAGNSRTNIQVDFSLGIKAAGRDSGMDGSARRADNLSGERPRRGSAPKGNDPNDVGFSPKD